MADDTFPVSLIDDRIDAKLRDIPPAYKTALKEQQKEVEASIWKKVNRWLRILGVGNFAAILANVAWIVGGLWYVYFIVPGNVARMAAEKIRDDVNYKVVQDRITQARDDITDIKGDLRRGRDDTTKLQDDLKQEQTRLVGVSGGIDELKPERVAAAVGELQKLEAAIAEYPDAKRFVREYANGTTPWHRYEPETTWSAFTSADAWYRRVGGTVELDVRVAITGPPAGTRRLFIPLPPELTRDFPEVFERREDLVGTAFFWTRGHAAQMGIALLAKDDPNTDGGGSSDNSPRKGWDLLVASPIDEPQVKSKSTYGSVQPEFFNDSVLWKDVIGTTIIGVHASFRIPAHIPTTAPGSRG